MFCYDKEFGCPAGASGKVVKALRGGVQDVAVKQLLHTNAAAVEKFLEVRRSLHPSGCTRAA